MNAAQFVSLYRREMMDKHLAMYKTSFKEAVRRPEQNSRWQNMLRVWDSLNDQQREAVLQFIGLTMVETASGLFSLLDGSAIFNEYREGFELRYGPSGEVVSGELLDYFLADEEENPPGKLWNPES